MGGGGTVARQNKLVGILNSRNRPAAASARDIHDLLLHAIVVQDLPPKTKLGEEMLVEIFNLGRRHVSAALDQLTWERLVTRVPNRGAWVAAPDAEEAREIMAARRAIETGIVEALVRADPQPDFSAVETAMALEATERARGRVRQAIRLSGGFHVLLARLSGNRILADQVDLLVARSSLVIALNDSPTSLVCWHDDHAELIRLIQARNLNAATALMQHHLEELLRTMVLTRQAPSGFDARTVFEAGM